MGVAFKLEPRVTHFVKEPEMRYYTFNKKNLKLEINPLIFPPSAQGGTSLPNAISVAPNESVIDIGTGSGILAILAAKMGGIVSSTDTDSNAILTTQKNAVLNGVRINLSRGKYFAGFNKKFDVIIANLPQELIPPSYAKAIGKKLAKTINGGKNGNQVLLNFLKIAKNHMHENSRLYIGVHTLTDYKSTLKEIAMFYDARLVSFNKVSTKEFVEDNIGWYKKFNEQGKINIFRNNKNWGASIFNFELMLKKKVRLKEI